MVFLLPAGIAACRKASLPQREMARRVTKDVPCRWCCPRNRIQWTLTETRLASGVNYKMEMVPALFWSHIYNRVVKKKTLGMYKRYLFRLSLATGSCREEQVSNFCFSSLSTHSVIENCFIALHNEMWFISCPSDSSLSLRVRVILTFSRLLSII